MFEKHPHLIRFLKDFPDFLIDYHKYITQKNTNKIAKLLKVKNKEKTLNTNSTEKIQLILKGLWVFYQINFEIYPEDKKIISAILDLDSSREIFYSNPFFFELLMENLPEIIIEDLESQKTLQSKNSEDIAKLIVEISSKRMEDDFSMEFKESISEGGWKILNFILENKLNILDAMDSRWYWELSEINSSLPEKLLDEAKKKCTKKDILNQECFSKILENMMEWIFSKYEDVLRYLEDFEEIIQKDEMQIIYLYLSLSSSPSKSSLKKFSPLPEFFLKFIFEDFNENKEKIVSLLISESLYLFNKISKDILENALLQDIAKLYFSKVNEIYKHNEEILVKKYAQFLNLLIDDSKYRPSFGLFEGFKHTIYDDKQDVYYYCDYREIINLLFEFRPPPKLFNQNRLFLKFLILPEALKIQKYNDFIKSLKTLPKFTEMGESEKTN